MLPRLTLPMIKYLMTLSKNSGRASIKWWSAAPSARARSSSARAAGASMPPQLTVTVTTGRLYVSLSHGTQNEVSSPPENARTMGFEAEVMSVPSSDVAATGL